MIGKEEIKGRKTAWAVNSNQRAQGQRSCPSYHPPFLRRFKCSSDSSPQKLNVVGGGNEEGTIPGHSHKEVTMFGFSSKKEKSKERSTSERERDRAMREVKRRQEEEWDDDFLDMEEEEDW